DYVLNGEKCCITNASFASFYVVFATSDASKRHRGIAAFIVDRDTPGLRVGKHEDKLGQRASDTAAVSLAR
ncbi:MAG TPA: acyl-CoA dehydrogenase family protein, partial [Polyangiaceae bacterium]|nr:acyl-CoA dehydrogenase family protein [Polyangiaceae bacterium]